MEINEAAEVAAMLNEICGAAVTALQQDTPSLRVPLAANISHIAIGMTDAPALATFMNTVAAWLQGQAPDQDTLNQLEPPFRRAIERMQQQVALAPSQSPEHPGRPESDASPLEPEGVQLLAQLSAAVVAATKSGSEGMRQQVAAHLLTVGGRLPPSFQANALPLLENLRALLGGADYAQLPPIRSEPFSALWQSIGSLMVSHDLTTDTRTALLDRLIHNTIFAIRSGHPGLTQALAQSLAELSQQAATTKEPLLADFLLQLQYLLQGQPAQEPPPEAPPEYHHAWAVLARTLNAL